MERVANFKAKYEDVLRDSKADVAELGLSFDEIVGLKIDTSSIDAARGSFAAREDAARVRLDSAVETSEQSRLDRARESLVVLQNRLDAPTRRYQEYLTALKQWEDAGLAIQGEAEGVESISGLKEELRRIASLPSALEVLTTSRMGLCRKVYEKLSELKDHYRRLYKPVQEFIKSHSTLAQSINLSFDVRIGESGFVDSTTSWIHQGRSGSFQGAEEGTNRLKALMQRHSFDTADGVEAFLTEFMQVLQNDVRHDPARPISTKAQIKVNKSVAEFYDFVFGIGYLAPRYALRMDGKELFELSPGERGLLLLLFYLLVEKSDCPLVLDQPEENLDNETVHDVLVPSIRLAKGRRQILVVTHNPNLAVVSDADQVIAACIDKKAGCKVSYESGALESRVANQYVVRYLEGTMPAFMNREQKYMKP
jgi:hypothetical protein